MNCGNRHFHVTPEGKLALLPGLPEALAALGTGGYVWLDYCRPERAELEALAGPFGLHPLSIEDCFDDNQIPKIDDYPRYNFILFNAFSFQGRSLAVGELDLFIGENFLVSVSRPGPGGLSPMEGVERAAAQDADGIRRGPAFLLHVLLDQVVDLKFVALDALEDDLNGVEESLLADAAAFDAADLLRLRRQLQALRKSLFHEREILIKICRKDCPYIPEGAIYAYRDIYDHLAKFLELTESYRDIVTSLMEMHLAMLNNDMSRAANATNASVRRLTLITTIFMPLTLLAGIGGMSEWSMMTGPRNWPIAYPAFMLAMVVIGAANYWWLRRLERRGRSRQTPRPHHGLISPAPQRRLASSSKPPAPGGGPGEGPQGAGT